MIKTLIIIIFLGLSVAITDAQQKQVYNRLCVNSVFAENIDTTDERKIKNTLFNTSGIDLTTRNPNLEYFTETFIPRGLTAFPVEESSDIVVGKVLKIQPYFSQDKSQIYTETVIKVEEILKNESSKLLSASKTITLTELGGFIKLDSGKVVSFEVNIVGRGHVCNEKRYVFFIENINTNNDFQFIRIYELDGGKVYTVGKIKRNLVSKKNTASYQLPNEEDKFLDKLRKTIKNQP